jgi:Spx/MgsR family transcriptional regulator
MSGENVMYGIPNCDTIKKARKWMQQHDVEYRFHNYKKDGTDPAQLSRWADQLGWDKLINKRGNSWRKLDEDTRNNMDLARALEIMQQNPSIIKRPLIETASGKLLLGFDEKVYQQEFLPT